jgi:hypothetical protein
MPFNRVNRKPQSDLKNMHISEPVWIIGRGPSLQYLKKEDIGDGVIIALNQSIIIIESLNLPNKTYSMQKDGGTKKRVIEGILSPDCYYSGLFCSDCGDMVRPKSATLLLHEHESKYCFPDYPDCYVLSLKELGLECNVFSFIFAIKTAQYMGCLDFNFVSFDVYTSGDNKTYTPGEGVCVMKSRHFEDSPYKEQLDTIFPYIKELNRKWILPEREE